MRHGCSLVKVSRWQVQQLWPWYRGSIKRAADENPEVSVDETARDLLSGHAQLWQLVGGVMVTRVDKYHDHKTLVVCLLSGYGLWTWGPALDQATQDVAKGWNCQKVKIIGRRAWEKLLKPYGYSFQTIEMVKEV